MKTIAANPTNDTVLQSNERAGRPLGRLAELFRRRVAPSYRMAPPLRNAHYIGVHMAAAANRSAVR